MLREKRGILIVVILLISLTFVLAGFEVGEPSHSIKKVYGPSDDLLGWINISLEDAKSNLIFEDSLDNSISLVDLIKLNDGFEYNCSTQECGSDYIASNPTQTKNLNLANRGSELIGIKFSGEITSISSIEFFIDSDAPWSCYNQLEIDFLNDGTIEFGNNKASQNSCSFLRNYGCFDENQPLYEPSITTIPYCQRIKLFESPGFKLGAWVYEETAGSRELTMALYNPGGELLRSCKLTKSGIGSGNEISCEVDYLATKSKDYYVCIYSDEGSGTYRARGYSGATNCGFNSFPVSSETNSYQIFAEGKAFGAVGILNVSNTLPDGSTLNSKVSNYIMDTYGSFDCTNDCVVPIKINSGENQQVSIRNLKATIDKPGLSGIIENKFYDLSETPSSIDAGFQKLYLDNANFTLPNEYGGVDYQLTLDDEEIFTEQIQIATVPAISSLSPLKTASAFPTRFTATVQAVGNITSFEWDFGDGTTEVSSTNEIIHTYAVSGTYNLNLIVKDELYRETSKGFEITVGLPKDVINSTIEGYYYNLNNIKNQINSYDEFSQKSLKPILDVDNIEAELKRIEKDYRLAFFEEEYNAIIEELLTLKVPNAVLTTKSASNILFFPKEKYIDLYILETIGGGSYDIGDEDKYIKGVLFWDQENIQTRITYKEISGKYDSTIKPLIRIFEVDITEKQALESDPYVIIRKLDDMKFKEDYLENEESGYIYTQLTNDQRIIFSTTEDVDFVELPLFVSPQINRLLINPDPIPANDDGFSNWILFILIVFLLLLIGFITYVVLQIWYKNKYENYLFKNRNNLYNLLTYIQNARKRSLKDSEIAKKLKKAGWKSEQINYALKKHAGKRTGMLEIPIDKILGKVKQKKFPQNNQRFPGTRRI